MRVNLIAGSLGVGKTTAVNALLKQRPSHERWAVLINEYGLVGLDAALLDFSTMRGAVEVREVAGGCICCSAGLMFEAALVLLLHRRPTRLLIEPTGLATLTGILDTLARPGIREAVDVRSTVTLVDPAKVARNDLPSEGWDQIAAADVVLANRCDLASSAELLAFDRWAQTLDPSEKRVARIERGQIPLELLDHAGQTTRPPGGAERHHVHQRRTEGSEPHGHPAQPAPPLRAGPTQPVLRRTHESPLASTVGWSIWGHRVFDRPQVGRWIGTLAGQPGLHRLKAVLHTNEGWYSFNVGDGRLSTQAVPTRPDSRIELVWSGTKLPAASELEQELLTCLTPSR